MSECRTLGFDRCHVPKYEVSAVEWQKKLAPSASQPVLQVLSLHAHPTYPKVPFILKNKYDGSISSEVYTSMHKKSVRKTFGLRSG